jgi:hypothetical protein
MSSLVAERLVGSDNQHYVLSLPSCHERDSKREETMISTAEETEVLGHIIMNMTTEEVERQSNHQHERDNRRMEI